MGLGPKSVSQKVKFSDAGFQFNYVTPHTTTIKTINLKLKLKLTYHILLNAK